MYKLCNVLKQYGLDLNIHVTADKSHVRYSWKKDLYPGGRTFTFWELENLGAAAIEDQLVRAIEEWADLVERLAENEFIWN